MQTGRLSGDSAESEVRRLLDKSVKLNLEDYRCLLLELNPEGPKKEEVADLIRAATTAESMNEALSKNVKRDLLVPAVLRGGLGHGPLSSESSKYQHTDITINHYDYHYHYHCW